MPHADMAYFRVYPEQCLHLLFMIALYGEKFKSNLVNSRFNSPY